MADAITTGANAKVAKDSYRFSLPFFRSTSTDSSSRLAKLVDVVCMLEHPPVVFHGSRQGSTGALFYGKLSLLVKADGLSIDSLVATLNIHITHKLPFRSRCKTCRHSYIRLETWQLLGRPATLARGTYLFPFFTFLAGCYPASLNTSVVSIAYEFQAEAVLIATMAAAVSPIRTIFRFDHVVDVKRSIPQALPRHSIRIFPRTNIKVNATYTAVIHPTGSNRLSLKLEGLVSQSDKPEKVDIWRLKQISWVLQQTIRTVAPACDKHTTEANPAQSNLNGVLHQEMRVVGGDEIFDGWKSDSANSAVDIEFEFGVNQKMVSYHRGKEPNYACETETYNDTKVSHSLVIELIIYKEIAPVGEMQLASPTGMIRTLRMKVCVVMTESPGTYISWDNEVPPAYQDVPYGPPDYTVVLDYTDQYYCTHSNYLST